jgi:CheY-like chemotaxis protein
VKGRVLVIDDEPSIRELLTLILDTEGYEVTQASEGAEALRLAEAIPPDVILLDLKMPGMDGSEFARRYHGMRGKKAPIVVITAVQRIEDATDVDACAYLAKPFELQVLLDAISSCTAKGIGTLTA